MGELLAKSDSSYYPSFLQIHNDVRYALDEAQDIDTHLRPLASHFELNIYSNPCFILSV